MFAGSVLRVAVDAASIDGGSSIGESSHRQNLESSICSQELHEPITASANTPRVGRLTRLGGTGETSAYSSSRLALLPFACGSKRGSRWLPRATGSTSEFPMIPIRRLSTTDATLRLFDPGARYPSSNMYRRFGSI